MYFRYDYKLMPWPLISHLELVSRDIGPDGVTRIDESSNAYYSKKQMR